MADGGLQIQTEPKNEEQKQKQTDMVKKTTQINPSPNANQTIVSNRIQFFNGRKRKLLGIQDLKKKKQKHIGVNQGIGYEKLGGRLQALFCKIITQPLHNHVALPWSHWFFIYPKHKCLCCFLNSHPSRSLPTSYIKTHTVF